MRLDGADAERLGRGSRHGPAGRGGGRVRLKRPYVARLDQVVISREGEQAVIAYREPGVYVTHLKLGPRTAQLSDAEILEAHNAVLLTQAEMAASYVHVAVEVPAGGRQIRRFDRGDAWVPRGDVLRCVVTSEGAGEDPALYVDDQRLSWREFGQLLLTWEGWGLRIVCVPEDELTRPPRIAVQEPDDRA